MAKFVGRTKQLAFLNETLQEIRRTGVGKLLSVRGRRQIGKSRLIEEFIERSGTSSVFYTASRQSPERESDLFAEIVASSNLQAAELARAGSLVNWESALTVLGSEGSRENPLIIVLDEFPYLVESDKTRYAIEGTIQKVWDRHLERRPVMLILVGSDLSTMTALNDYRRPLYGRQREMIIPPLSPFEVAQMVGRDAADSLDAYTMIGGFPRLATAWKHGETLWRFLKRQLSDSSSWLYVLAERSLNAEFPSDIQAQTVLNVIGHGERSFKTIGMRSGVNDASLALALTRLENKGVIAKPIPYSNRRTSKTPRYYIADPYLRFWLRFLGPSIGLLDRGRSDIVVEQIKQGWNDYRGKAIEPIIRNSIEQTLPQDRFGNANFVGSFWTRDGRIEIDLVGGQKLNYSQTIDFIGSIKWREKTPFDRTDTNNLITQLNNVPGANANTKTVAVSRSGFSNSPGVDIQLTPEEILRAWK